MKNILLAISSGLLLAIGWPTYGFPLFLFFGFVPLLITEYKIRNNKFHKSQVFGLAFLALFIWNMITTWWIYNSTPFGMWFAEIVNSLLMALVFLIYHIIARRASFTIGSIFLICIWMSFEYLHLQWQFSWPWLNLGNGFANFTSWIQWYEYTGTFGGSLWIWIVNIGIYKSVLLFIEHKDKSILYRSAIRNGLVILIPILISFIILKTYEEDGQDVEVIILQPNINPYTEKYNTTDDRVGTLLNSLTASKISNKTDFIIAPETVFADNNRLKNFQSSIAKKTALSIISKYPKSNFLSGISLIDVFRDPSKVHSQTNEHKSGVFYDDYNSAFFVRPDGTDELYHKSKLVVGVENFPYQSIFKPIVGDAMIDLGGTVAKKTTQSDREVFFTKEGIGAGPIICYESVYGEFVSGYVRNNADFLAIITNDAWWGVTQGHKQHLAYAKFRAIETRRSIARSANTGISAIIDQTGTIVSSLGYNEQGALKGTLKTNDKITFYVKAGDYLARVAIFLMIFIFLFSVTRRRKKISIP
ncbi:apolipoprotein N-acyltransferase [Aquimarina sp. BL5]|uniref:apolipoprotein N-acyltransferase n=1 Tax=Aquimarina sp. BL5 TaxID=1714860 RepID=UPI000E4BA0EF|nr:apolipoprotein N-acyltransferase [Aquimarina sp. BL5]AXT50807.1 apolipoprotein N-acyltransferase [Aquimarina sp. BL5]RKN05856.1 apolipoprotein N-acyltransferase [Aquimarina sp. BL5]